MLRADELIAARDRAELRLAWARRRIELARERRPLRSVPVSLLRALAQAEQDLEHVRAALQKALDAQREAFGIGARCHA